MTAPRVKICCISSVEEAELAIEFGASALGLVGEMPSGPGIIEDELIFNISKRVPPPIATFLLTSETCPKKIVEHYHKTKTNTIQLVDSIQNNAYQEIRNQLPNLKLVQVIHVINEKSVNEAIEKADFVDALLLDSGNPNLDIKELGGTGRTHNWEISKIIRKSVHIPVFLAGGLNPENIKRAIDEVEPFGVDLCSGVRTNNRLDPRKLEMFFNSLR